jgi:hemerythrin-like domain-containing protein
MHKAERIILDEHRSISAVLSGLKELARMARETAERPDFTVFRAMVYYIDAFPERMHHPKEDLHLFDRLVARHAQARPLVASLRGEHEQGARMIRELEQALLAYEQTWPLGGDFFQASIDRYARFHWDHMRREERDLLPLAEAFLTEADWAALDDAFAGNEDPIADLRTQDFEQLFQRILTLAPAPVGLGDPWQRRAHVG